MALLCGGVVPAEVVVAGWVAAGVDRDTITVLPSEDSGGNGLDMIARLRGRLDVLVVEGDVPLAVITHQLLDLAPAFVLCLTPSNMSSGANPGVHADARDGAPNPWQFGWNLFLEVESWGAPICMRVGTIVFGMDLPPAPVRTHGPAAPRRDDGATTLWPVEDWLGLGIKADIDRPEVQRAIVQAQRGHGPLYGCPGFPVALPPHPINFGDDKGILVAPGARSGWRIFHLEDLLSLQGYPRMALEGVPEDARWAALRAVIPVRFRAAMLRWIDRARDSRRVETAPEALPPGDDLPEGEPTH
jgi:hypothetical protein